MNRFCPVCGCEQNNLLYELCSNMAILGGGFPAVKSRNVVCSDCGCVFVDADFSQCDFSKYYSDTSMPIDYFKMFGKNESIDYYEEILSTFSRYLSPQSRIIEIGCGTGDFLVFLKNNGYSDVIGIDVSKKCIEQAKQKQVNCYIADIADVNFDSDHRYDVVILSHTLEHILDSGLCIENVKKLMKPNGLLYIEVPDASRYCDVNLSPFFFLTYEHLTHYSHQTLRNLGVKSGLKDILFKQFFKCSKYYVHCGLYELGKSDCEFKNERETKGDLNRYLQDSKNQMREFIGGLADRKLILWGIGASTAPLLQLFDQCNVIQLIDKNVGRQGLTFDIGGKLLITQDPKDVLADATIVILPEMYADSIAEQIRNMGLLNEIVFTSRALS